MGKCLFFLFFGKYLVTGVHAHPTKLSVCFGIYKPHDLDYAERCTTTRPTFVYSIVHIPCRKCDPHRMSAPGGGALIGSGTGGSWRRGCAHAGRERSGGADLGSAGARNGGRRGGFMFSAARRWSDATIGGGGLRCAVDGAEARSAADGGGARSGGI